MVSVVVDLGTVQETPLPSMLVAVEVKTNFAGLDGGMNLVTSE